MDSMFTVLKIKNPPKNQPSASHSSPGLLLKEEIVGLVHLLSSRRAAGFHSGEKNQCRLSTSALGVEQI